LETVSDGAEPRPIPGHLVFATLAHPVDCPDVAGFIDVFPPISMAQGADPALLSPSGIVTRQLSSDPSMGRGRAVACEVLIADAASRTLIARKTHRSMARADLGRSRDADDGAYRVRLVRSGQCPRLAEQRAWCQRS